MIQPDTVVAISTPRGKGGIGIVRLSGPAALSISQQVFRSRRPLGERIRYVEYGRIWAGGRAIDTGVAWCFAAPHSYTGEDTVEISCHGSMVVLESVVEEALRLGAVAAAPGEFTRRAFLNGRLDLLEAEAVIDLIQASSKAHLDNAYGLASGRLSKMVKELKGQLVKMLSLLEVGLDFSDEDIDIGRQEIQAALSEVVESSLRLAETFEGTRRRQEGYLVVLIGRPNVGKSTLLNVLLGEDRAIVTPLPGTTRDLVEGRTTWAGETIRIVDTAGIRQSHNLIEKEGIERASQAAGEADVVLAVFDSSTESCEDDIAVLDLLPSNKKSIAVFNKIDLTGAITRSKIKARTSVSVEISALRESGIERLKKEVTAQLPHRAEIDGIGITRQRHQDCFLRVAKSGAVADELLRASQPDECIVAELQDALNALGEMLGETVEEEVLDSIFSQFCIGK